LSNRNIGASEIGAKSQALGNVPVERSAMLMEALLGTPVSAGFVAKAHQRFADKLASAGFDEAMKTALHSEDVRSPGPSPGRGP
jgi:transposase